MTARSVLLELALVGIAGVLISSVGSAETRLMPDSNSVMTPTAMTDGDPNVALPVAGGGEEAPAPVVDAQAEAPRSGWGQLLSGIVQAGAAATHR